MANQTFIYRNKTYSILQKRIAHVLLLFVLISVARVAIKTDIFPAFEGHRPH